MNSNLSLTPDGVEKRKQLSLLRKEYADLYTHKEFMMTDERNSLYIIYLNTLGHLNYEIFCANVELSAWKMKVQVAQSAVNRSEKPDVVKIEQIVDLQMNSYYQQIKEQAKQLELAKEAKLLEKERAKELKELYHLLVKRLHPNLHPYQSDKMSDLFLQVQTAYHTQNLELLQQIVLTLDLDDIDSKDNLFAAENIDAYIESLKPQIVLQKQEIAQLEDSFPFIFRDQLSDDEWVLKEKNKLFENLQKIKDEKEVYEERFNLLIEL